MKKILSCIFSASIILFTACSSDSGNDIDVPNDGKVYPVTFDVSTFKMDKEPLSPTTRGDESESKYIKFAIYKEDGTVAITKGNDLATETVNISEKLAAGNYYFAALVAPGKYSVYKDNFTAFNLETDCYYPIGNTPLQGVYFKLTPFTVNPTDDNAPINCVLQPTWSTVKVVIEDKATCTFPNETATIELSYAPLNDAFKIKDQKGFFYVQTIPNVVLTEAAIKTAEALYWPATFQSDDSTLKLIYKKANGDVISEKVIYQGAWVSGQDITFKGQLGDQKNPNPEKEKSFEVTLSDMSYEDIEF